MNKLTGIFLFFLFLSQPFFAQMNEDGMPFINSYTDKDYGVAGQIWAITQDNRGVMYFGCNYGLKTFDGKNWQTYNNQNSTIVRSLGTDEAGNVYYGAESDFGMLMTDAKGKLNFHSLFLDKFPGDSIDFGAVWKTIIADNKVFFQSFSKVFYCDLPLKFEKDSLINELKVINSDAEAPFHLSFGVDNQFYIRQWGHGLFKFSNEKLELIPGGERFALSKIYTILPYDEKHILIGTRSKGFFLYDKTKKKNAITPFRIDKINEISNSAIYNGIELPGDKFAVGTLMNGIFIFNKKGKVVNHWGEQSGLPYQFVLTLYVNNKTTNPKMWIFYQDNGIYSADISGAFFKWGANYGIEGIVNDIERYKSKLYFAADNNLFYLNKKARYPEFVKIHSENQNIWDLFTFKVPGTSRKILLASSVTAIYQINDTVVSKISEAENAHVLYQSEIYPERLYVGTDAGLFYMNYEKGRWSDLIRLNEGKSHVLSILEDKQGVVVGVSNSGGELLKNIDDKEPLILDSTRGLPLLGNDYFIRRVKDKVVIVSGSGLHYLTPEDSVKEFTLFGKKYSNELIGVYQFVQDKDDYWLSVYDNNINPNHRLVRFQEKNNKPVADTIFAGILPSKSTFCIYPDKDKVWIGNENGLFMFDKNVSKNYQEPYNALITKVLTSGDSVLFGGIFGTRKDSTFTISLTQSEEEIPMIDYKNNVLFFEWAAPFFEREEDTEFSFRLLGESEKWSKWSKKKDTRFTNMFEGDYTFEVKARNIYNNESRVAQYHFTILPPWYRTWWAYLSFLIIGLFLIYVIIKLYTKKLKRENEKLEQIVKERTAEIRMQNEEITAQRDEIQAQKEEVEKAKEKIEDQQKSIMDSIHYASRIQGAVLPPDDYLKQILGTFFVLFRPRDIVSGDFYWATQRDNKIVIVAADCTGHGVPGAFMSMLGMSFLNEIVNKEGVLHANIILNRLRENVKRSLRQTGKDNEAKDGMDIAVCVIDKTEMKLQFAGAYNPLLIIRDGKIDRVKADRMPIGIYLREKASFTNNIIDIKEGDLLYIFSDGYVDQFGGTDDSKIRSNKFKEILLENHQKPLEEQKKALNDFLEFWMNHLDKYGKKYKQVDDILVIGIKI